MVEIKELRGMMRVAMEARRAARRLYWDSKRVYETRGSVLARIGKNQRSTREIGSASACAIAVTLMYWPI